MKLVRNRMGSMNIILQNIKKDFGKLENTTYTMKQIVYEGVFSSFGIIYKWCYYIAKTVPYGYGGNNRCKMVAKGGA